MCTLTWNRKSAADLEVFFNRDELKNRLIADPPTRHEWGGVSFLSPRDPKGGGTWMLANDLGVVVCLLNKWELEGRSIKSQKSRGALVREMAEVSSPNEARKFLVGLQGYQAFTLVVFSPTGDGCWEWDGVKLVTLPVPPILTSSSYRADEVRRSREACFSAGLRGEAFHESRNEKISAHSVRMNRPDAQTWSRSVLKVTDRISWRYFAEHPDLVGPPDETVVELKLR